MLWRREFPNHPIFQYPLFSTEEYKRFELEVRSAVAIAVTDDPHTVAIQKAIPAVGDRLHTMTGVIQNSQVTYTQAFRSLETKIEQLTNVITDFAGGTFTLQHIPSSKLNVLPPRGAASGLAAPIIMFLS